MTTKTLEIRLREVRYLKTEVDVAEVALDRKRERLYAAIRGAQKAGASLAQVAAETDLSRERIRRIGNQEDR